MKVEIKVNGFEDRRNLCAILADNGLSVKVEERKNYKSIFSDDSFVIFEANPVEE